MSVLMHRRSVTSDSIKLTPIFNNAKSGSIASSATVAVTMPDNLKTDTVTLVFLLIHGAVTMSSVPSGWTLVHNLNHTSDGTLRVWVYRCTGTPASSTWTLSGAPARAIWGSASFDLCDTGAPIDAQAILSDTISDGNALVPTCSPTVANGLHVTSPYHLWAEGFTDNAPAGYTRRINQVLSSVALGVFTKPLTAAGATGTITHARTPGGNSFSTGSAIVLKS